MKKQPKDYKNYTFNGQRQDESVLFVFRRHMIVMRKGFYLLLIPLVIGAIPPLIRPDDLKMLLLPVAGLGIGLILFFYHFILWYFSIYIVTDRRIRQTTQLSFFGKEVVELRLSKIQNISFKVPGLTGELFKFGTIVIQTFAGNLVIKNVEKPEEITNKLNEAVDKINESRETHEEDI